MTGAMACPYEATASQHVRSATQRIRVEMRIGERCMRSLRLPDCHLPLLEHFSSYTLDLINKPSVGSRSSHRSTPRRGAGCCFARNDRNACGFKLPGNLPAEEHRIGKTTVTAVALSLESTCRFPPSWQSL